jgi:RNA polymerase sigma-70 factor (sigma-E family)
MPGSADDDFAAFARHAGPRLRRTAYLLCRDWDFAQDLTQTTLAKLFVRWSSIRRSEEPTAYANKVLLRIFLDDKRLRRSREQVLADVPQTAVHDSDPALRVTLVGALSQLSDRDRAIVVMRYWEDLSVDTVAQAVGVSEAVVKSQSARALARLRALLGSEVLAGLRA